MAHPDNDEKTRWLAQETPETVLEPELPIIDPHHHLWRVPSPWGTYDLEDLWVDTGSGHNVEQTVFIDARSGYRQDGPEHLKPIGERVRSSPPSPSRAHKRRARPLSGRSSVTLT